MPESHPSQSGLPRPKVALYAAAAMLALAAVTLLSVLAYFASVKDPWTWRALVAIATIPFALLCGWLVWRTPTRENAGASLLVVAFSLARVGFPGEWTTATYVLMALTIAVAVPVAWAARVLPP